MTDKTKPTLTAERFIGRLRRRHATSGERLTACLREAEARFYKREAAWRCQQLADVVDAERGPAVTMAQALGLEIDVVPEQAPPPSNAAPESDPTPSEREAIADSMTPPKPGLEEYDGVPERLREPLSPERLKVGRR